MEETPKNEETTPKVEPLVTETVSNTDNNQTEKAENKETAKNTKQQKAENKETAKNAKTEKAENKETAKTAKSEKAEEESTDKDGKKITKKVKKTPSIPTTYMNVSIQAKTVLRQWANNNPQFDCPTTPYRTLQTESTKFETFLRTRTEQKSDKRGNTNALTDVNKRINEAVSIFRRYLKAEYPTVRDFAQHYQYYGFLLNDAGNYVFPRDNDQRANALDIIVSRFNEANNPFANRDFGLAHWTQLKQDHNQAWNKSDDLRSTRASLVSDTAQQYKLLKNYLKDLHDYIKLVYRHQDAKAALRSFGFLKESL